MKRKITILILLLTLLVSFNLGAQEKASSWSAGVDLYSSYVWRGTKFGTGPAVQPSVKFTTGGLTLGVWGSFDASGYTEADPYISYSFPFGLSLGLTDYYYPGATGSALFSDDSHAAELNLGFTTGGLSLSANYILNEAPIPASVGDDMYFQAGYAFKNFSLAVGAGNGWHTSDAKFNICNISLGTSKTIEITDKFSIPVNGSIIVNPEREQLFVVVGISL
jgi:uncharacterized protein (TIGR02001 family)